MGREDSPASDQKRRRLKTAPGARKKELKEKSSTSSKNWVLGPSASSSDAVERFGFLFSSQHLVLAPICLYIRTRGVLWWFSGESDLGFNICGIEGVIYHAQHIVREYVS
jgi:hypothetical protein